MLSSDGFRALCHTASLPLRSVCRTAVLLLPLLMYLTFCPIPACGATLSVTMAGTGQGSVNSSPPGIACPGICNGTFTSIALYSNPAIDSYFSGWGSACAGMENCSLALAGDLQVTAFFELKSNQLGVSGSNYGAIQEAYNNVASGGRIIVVARNQPGDLNLDKAIDVTLEGGFDDAFTSNADNFTKIQGTVFIREGSLAIKRILLSAAAVGTPPAAPDGVTAVAGDTSAVINWNDVTGATSYNVYFSLSPGVSRASGTKITGAVKGNAITGLTNGATYYVVVTAVDANGESVESSQVIITPFNATAPSPPDVVSASAGNGTTEVNWSDVAGAGYYSVYWSTSPGVTTTTGTKISPVAASPYQHSSLTNGTTYYYIVTANIGPVESAASMEASARPAAAAVNSRLLKMAVYAVKKGKTSQSYTLYEYDEASGLVHKESNYADTGIGTSIFTGSLIYEYDGERRVVKRSNYNINGDLFGYTTTGYNAAGNPQLITTYSGYGSVFIPAEYTVNDYDLATGKLLLVSTTYNGISHLTLGQTRYEYNSNGDVTKQTSYTPGGMSGYTTTEYNDDRKIIKESKYDLDGNLTEYAVSEYNTAKKRTKKTVYNGFTGLMTGCTTYEYNQAGKLCKTNMYDFASNLTGYSTISYNSDGKQTMISVYDETGLVTARTTYEYGY